MFIFWINYTQQAAAGCVSAVQHYFVLVMWKLKKVTQFYLHWFIMLAVDEDMNSASRAVHLTFLGSTLVTYWISACVGRRHTSLETTALTHYTSKHYRLEINHLILHRSADKSLARPGRKQVTATEEFEFHISYL